MRVIEKRLCRLDHFGFAQAPSAGGGSDSMTSRSISRRLDRLEAQWAPVSEEPLVVVLNYVSTDGEVSEACRVTLPRVPPNHWERHD